MATEIAAADFGRPTLFILGTGKALEKGAQHGAEKITVTYEIDEETVNYLNTLTARWKATGREITLEELFSFTMTMDGNTEIRHYLDVIDRFLKRHEE